MADSRRDSSYNLKLVHMMSEAKDASILGSNLTAVEAISAKLAEVARLAEKLDARLCEAGARTRPTAVASSTSSLLSMSATSSLGTPIRAISNASTSIMTTSSAATSNIQIRPASSEITPAIVLKFDVAKSDVATARKFDNTSPHIPSHVMEHVETSSKDSSNKETAINKETVENPRSESTAEEHNVEVYTTATECSATPPPRSRSESFSTSPECEDLATAAIAAPSCPDSTWATETPKPITTIASLTSAPNDERQILTKTIASTVNEAKPVTRVKAMDKITDERSGRIRKEVTETTVLRVSHDIRLDVASYTLTSNTVHNRRQHIDAKDIRNVERVLPEVESSDKTDGVHEFDLSAFKKSDKYNGVHPKEVQLDQSLTTKLIKIREHALNDSSHSKLKESASLSSRHHEDSGIEMSPMKKDDNLEGEDFLERARKL